MVIHKEILICFYVILLTVTCMTIIQKELEVGKDETKAIFQIQTGNYS